MRDHIKVAFNGMKLLYKSNRKLFIKRLVITWLVSAFFTGAYAYNTKHFGHASWNILYLIGYGTIKCLPAVLFIMIFGFVLWSMARGAMKDAKQRREDGYKIADDDTTYGDARWATRSEIHEYVDVTTADEAEGIILGASRDENGMVYSWKRGGDIGNGHMLCMASSGRGKTFSTGYNMIMQDILMGRSFAVTDPSGEYAQYCYKLAKKRGYNAYILNFSEPDAFGCSDGFNPLANIDITDENNCVLEAQEIAHTFITNGSPEISHWSDVAEQLMTALALYVATEAQAYKTQEEKDRICNLRHVRELLAMSDDELKAELDLIQDDSPAYLSAQTFVNAKDTDRSAAKGNLSLILDIAVSKAVGEALSHNDINPVELGMQPTALFLIFSTSKDTYRILTSVFFEQLFGSLEKYAKRQYPEPKLPVPVHMILDEWPSIGIIPSFQGKINNVRKYGIDVSIFCQDVAQAEAVYGSKEMNSIMGACDVKLVLGVNDAYSAKWIQDNCGCGDATVETETSTVKDSRFTGIKGKEESMRKGLTVRKLMTVDALRTMDLDPLEEVICTAKGHPFKAKKFAFTKNVLYNEIERYNTWEHVPIYKSRVKEEEKKQSFSSRI